MLTTQYCMRLISTLTVKGGGGSRHLITDAVLIRLAPSIRHSLGVFVASQLFTAAPVLMMTHQNHRHLHPLVYIIFGHSIVIPVLIQRSLGEPS